MALIVSYIRLLDNGSTVTKRQTLGGLPKMFLIDHPPTLLLLISWWIWTPSFYRLSVR